MKKKTIFSVIATTLFATLFVAGAVYAGTITYNDELVVNNTGRFDSVYIGKQGTGGVTFFNGTIVNSTTNDGVDNPVTFGDNVRIDGEIWRGEQSGPFAGADAKDMPVKVNDDLKVYGNTTIDGALSNPTVDGKADTSYVDSGLAEKANNSDLGNYVNKSNPSWDTQKGYVSIPGNAIVSRDYINDYVKYEGGLFNPEANAFYEAPVELPHGAKITNFWVYGLDNNATVGNQIEVTVGKVVDPTDPSSSVLVGTATSTDSATFQTWTPPAITQTVVDNTQNYCLLLVDVQGTDSTSMGIARITIEYEFTSPY
ncbi:hypothetical protein KKH43_06165 [Patescibacteria group bacterium]|nr:hypothetical protein [Patescibacteria group bacterium]